MHSKSKLLLWGGVLGGPLFIVVFLIEGALRKGYSPFRHPISSLAIGDSGWIQITSFIVTGLLFLCFAFGLRARLISTLAGTWGPLLVGGIGIGLMGAGIFSTDPILGYPPELPFQLTQYHLHGHLHNAFSMLVFIGLPSACFVFRKRFKSTGEQGWAKYSLYSAVGMFTMFGLAGLGFGQVPGFLEYAGLFQRMSVVIGWTWMLALAIHFLRLPENNSLK